MKKIITIILIILEVFIIIYSVLDIIDNFVLRRNEEELSSLIIKKIYKF